MKQGVLLNNFAINIVVSEQTSYSRQKNYKNFVEQTLEKP